MTENTNGRFVWHDLMTTNVEQSLRFYGDLFPEWNIETIPMGEHTYYKIFVGDLSFGGFVGMEATARGPRTHWIGYVGVSDCDETMMRCQQHGGRVAVPAFNVPGIGKFAVIQDPQGAIVKPFQMQTPIELSKSPSVGHLCWNELHTNDEDGSRRFYQSVFGWSAVENRIPGSGSHTIFRAGERKVAGCVPLPDGFDASPAWLTYIYADDVECRVDKAESLGAQTYVPPRPFYGSGRFSVLADSNGAAFAIYSLG